MAQGYPGTRAGGRGLVAAGRGAERGDPVDRFLFERVVGVQVDLGGLGALVPEPERDRQQVDVLGAQQHRVGVPQHVRGDALAGSDGQRARAVAMCLSRSQATASGLSGPSLPGREQRVIGAGLGARRSQTRRTVTVSVVSVAQRSLRPLPVTLRCAPAPSVTSRIAQAGELGDAQPGLDRGQQQRVVAPAEPGARGLGRRAAL